MGNKLSLVSIIIVIVFALIGSTIAFELYKINEQNKAALLYRMYDDFFIKNPETKGILRAIENDSTILVQNGGKFEECDIDDYLGHFELLKNYVDEGIEPEKSVYNAYSYYIVKAYQNKEIWGYVERLRRETNDTTFYKSFEYLAKHYMAVDKK